MLDQVRIGVARIGSDPLLTLIWTRASRQNGPRIALESVLEIKIISVQEGLPRSCEAVR